jgi:ribonuclease D
VAQLAEQHWLPPENLLAPGVIREFAWRPPAQLTPGGIARELGHHGARPWQTELVSAPLARALSDR